MAAPPHLPAQPLHLLQLHDGGIMHRPRPLLSLARPLIFLSFWFVLPQIQHDRLVIHSTVKLLLVHPLENKPSVSFPPSVFRVFFSSVLFSPFPHTTLSSLSVGLSSPCLSVLLQSHLASRRLHSASYPFLKSAFQRGPAFLRFSLFFFSVNENFPTSEHKGKKPHASLQPN